MDVRTDQKARSCQDSLETSPLAWIGSEAFQPRYRRAPWLREADFCLKIYPDEAYRLTKISHQTYVMAAAPDGSSIGAHTPHDSAHSVGDAAKVKELEDEVASLAERLNNASARLAEHENEKQVLEAKLRQEQRRNKSIDATGEALLTAAPSEKPQLSRLGSILQRRPSPVATVSTPSERERELHAELAKERAARIAAEQKAKEAHEEIEELTESLFQQANEMVAAERKANAALKEKLKGLEQMSRRSSASASSEPEVLERENAKLRERVQLLQQRDSERRKRLEKIEAANKKIAKARELLIPR